jgi:hypothetical protein
MALQILNCVLPCEFEDAGVLTPAPGTSAHATGVAPVATWR